MKWAVGAVVAVMVGGLVLLVAGLLNSLPMVADRHLVEYAVVTEELGLEIPWHALVAVDAIRFQQDFGSVTSESIRETAALFSICQEPGIRDWTVSQNSERRFERSFPVLRPARLSWSVEVREGEVIAAQVLDEQDRPWESGAVLEPGTYRIVVDAVPEHSVYRILISLDSVTRCGPDEVNLVMDELGFEEDDREMALALLAAFLPPGEFLFHPNPTSPFHSPIDPPWRITSPFGFRLDPFHGGWTYHGGLDIGAPEGTPVRATAAGTVWFSGELADYGRAVRIDHGAFGTSYAHLSELLVEQGQVVDQGEIIGRVGNSGRSTGPHLHLEWFIGEARFDPMAAFR